MSHMITTGPGGGAGPAGSATTAGYVPSQVADKPMTPGEIGDLLKQASQSMALAKGDVLKLIAAVEKMGDQLTNHMTKLADALDGSMVSMDAKVRGYCDLAIDAARQTEALAAVLQPRPPQGS